MAISLICTGNKKEVDVSRSVCEEPAHHGPSLGSRGGRTKDDIRLKGTTKRERERKSGNKCFSVSVVVVLFVFGIWGRRKGRDSVVDRGR